MKKLLLLPIVFSLSTCLAVDYKVPLTASNNSGGSALSLIAPPGYQLINGAVYDVICELKTPKNNLGVYGQVKSFQYTACNTGVILSCSNITFDGIYPTNYKSDCGYELDSNKTYIYKISNLKYLSCGAGSSISAYQDKSPGAGRPVELNLKNCYAILKSE